MFGLDDYLMTMPLGMMMIDDTLAAAYTRVDYEAQGSGMTHWLGIIDGNVTALLTASRCITPILK